jgi:hypothetical protein
MIIKDSGMLENRWNNVYWFARMLINNDKYAAIGKDSKLLISLSSSLRVIGQENSNQPESETLQLQRQNIANLLQSRFKKAKTKHHRINDLITDLHKELNGSDDIEVFILTCENIVLPINQAIQNIPNNDKEFTSTIAKSYLDVHSNEGLATVINIWDDVGVRGSLTVERTEIVKIFATLRTFLSKEKNLSNFDENIILTTFVQEFERRVAQKRKQRAGGSLEDVTTFILDYYGIKCVSKPEHFQADIEVDKWIKNRDGWLTGISCKRTLRERWKQVSSADSAILSKYKIKQLLHIITYDEDLSDDKLTLLGGQRHIFYLPDGSRKLKNAENHIGLKDYVRPMSQFINDIKQNI